MKIKSAAELCVKLKESFTGSQKLQNIRVLLERKPNATSQEAYDALEADLSVPQTTLDKAKQFMHTGIYIAPETMESTKVSIEDSILGRVSDGTVAVANEAGQHIVNDAKSEAERIIADAQAKAEQMLADAIAKAGSVTTTPPVPPVPPAGDQPGVKKVETEQNATTPGVKPVNGGRK